MFHAFPSRLIVLSGEAGAGKDSVAKVLEQLKWKPYSLAAPLKRFGQDMFGFSDEQCYGPSHFRNAPDPRWNRPCPRCKATGKRPTYYCVPAPSPACVPPNYTGWCDCEECKGTGKINDNSPRRVFQLLGEEYLRQMIHVDALTIRARPELWSMLELVKLGEFSGIVVTDARNDNDRDNLHEWLGACRVDIRTGRATPGEKPAWRKHVSENRQPTDADVEYILRNDEEWPFPSLPARVDAMLADLYG